MPFCRRNSSAARQSPQPGWWYRITFFMAKSPLLATEIVAYQPDGPTLIGLASSQLQRRSPMERYDVLIIGAGPWEPPRGPGHRVPLQLAHKGDQSRLLPRRQLHAENEVEELHRILQGEQPPIVQVGRGILDPAQGEGLDRPLGM